MGTADHVTLMRLLEDVMPFCMPPPPPFHPKQNMEDTEQSAIKVIQSHWGNFLF